MNLKLNAVAVAILAVLSTSVFAAPPAPTLSYPAASGFSVSKTTPVTFSWNSVSGATNYRIVISQNSSFSGFNEYNQSCDSTCYTEKTGTVTSHLSKSRNLDGQTYYWRVRVNTANGASGWSQARSFTTTGANNQLSAKVDSFVSTWKG